MKIYNTSDPAVKPSIIMVVYGEGGVGKTTFASTAPRPIIADCENGSKYFGLRGISADVALIEHWTDMRDFLRLAGDSKYETIVVDPIGELMEKLMQYMVIKADGKLVQRDGAPTMAGWGWLKKSMRQLLKALRDSGKNVIIIAHVQEKDDDGRIVKRPMVATKISEELINLVDIVGYMTTVNDDSGDTKRIIIVDPTSDKQVAKDRTGKLGRYIEPDFNKIIAGITGDENYAWINKDAKPLKSSSDSKDSAAAEEEITVDGDFKEDVMDLYISMGFNSQGKLWFFKTCSAPFKDFSKLTDEEWRKAALLLQDIFEGRVQIESHHKTVKSKA